MMTGSDATRGKRNADTSGGEPEGIESGNERGNGQGLKDRTGKGQGEEKRREE